MSGQIPLFMPFVSELAIDNVCDVLRGSQLAEGPRVVTFEKDFSAMYGIPAIAVNSGSSALDLAFELIGLTEGDEVIVPVLGHPASVLPIVHRGAKVIFCDVRDTLTADAADALQKGKECTKLKAIVYVHFGGSDATIMEMKMVADHFKVPLIEDAAQCGPDDRFGVGDFTCFSLQAIKLLTAGDGGMLASMHRPQDLERAKKLRWFGFDRTVPADERDIEEPGFKYHMNDITAAIGHGNLKMLEDHVLEIRYMVQREYIKANIPLLTYSWLTILVHEKAPLVAAALRAEGIGCGKQHLRLDKLKLFANYPHVLPTMDRLEEQYLVLPSHHGLSRSDVERITTIIRTVLA